MTDYLEIGEIVNTHGVKGELKVIPLTDNPERYNCLDWVYIDIDGVLERMIIEKVKFLKGKVIIKFQRIDNAADAEKLKGMFLKVDRKNAVKLPEGSFFICDLIGCEVTDKFSGNKLGILSDVLKTGSNDVYVVKDSINPKKEILIPALKEVVKEVSIEDRRITVSLPKGLADDEV